MKEFDLEKAKAGHPVCTRDGREARIICFDRKNDNPIVALVENSNTEDILSYNNEGRSNDISKYSCDLFMRTVKQERWINLYKDLNGFLFPGASLYYSKKEAETEKEEDSESYSHYKTVKVEWDE